MPNGMPPREAYESLKNDNRATALMIYDSACCGQELWFKTNIPKDLLLANELIDENAFNRRQSVILKPE